MRHLNCCASFISIYNDEKRGPHHRWCDYCIRALFCFSCFTEVNAIVDYSWRRPYVFLMGHPEDLWSSGKGAEVSIIHYSSMNILPIAWGTQVWQCYVYSCVHGVNDLLQLRFAMIVQLRRQYWKFIFILRRYYDAPLHRIELVISFFCFSSDLTAAENKWGIFGYLGILVLLGFPIFVFFSPLVIG